VDITWLGHACFRLRSRDVTLVTDPYDATSLGYPPLSTSAQVVTLSHDHPHHAYLAAVDGQPRVLRGPGEYEIGGAMIWGVRTGRRGDVDGQSVARNTSYVVQMEDLTICHLGDLGFPLTNEQLTHIKDCHVLLVPVGGHCTIGATEAAEVIAQIDPRVIVPMHYATPETADRVPLDSLDRFCREMGATDVTPQSRLSVTAGSLPAEATVVLLEARR
jgi:L-ascorbate metabolism protein UlaG (beta-lactamase superfamily)